MPRVHRERGVALVPSAVFAHVPIHRRGFEHPPADGTCAAVHLGGDSEGGSGGGGGGRIGDFGVLAGPGAGEEMLDE